MNHALNDLIQKADIVRFVRSKRMAWLGHVMRMEEKKNTQKSTGVDTNRQEKQRKTREKID